MRSLLLYFNLLGFFTRIKRYPHQRQMDILILVVHSVVASFATYFIWLYLTRPVKDTLGTFNDILKFAVLLNSYYLSIFELYFNRHIQQHFWTLFTCVDQHFCSHQRFYLRNYLFQMKIYFAAAILSYIIYFNRLFANSRDKFLDFWFVYTYVVLIYQNRSFYYMFFMEVISYELQIIDRELNEMLFYCGRFHSGYKKTKKIFLEKFHRNRFKWIRQYYATIYEMNCTINEVFGWSNVAAILLSFHLILADINWFYWKLLNKYEFSILGNEFIQR